MPSSSKKRRKHSKATKAKMRASASTPEERERRRKVALANPYFNGKRNGELHTKDKWTEKQKENVKKRITKYNKSKAGKKMASKRSKALLKDEAVKQRWIDGQIAWHIEHPEARIKHVEKHLQPYNEERHRRAAQRNSIRWWREEYKKGIKPVVKPLPDQPQEYYDELDEFFAEGL